MYRPRRSAASEAEKSDAERWLVSYADYMTLLFALFVVLYSMANMEREQFKALQDTISKVFIATDETGTGIQGQSVQPGSRPQSDFEFYGSGLEDAAGPTLLADNPKLEQIDSTKPGSPLVGIQKDINRALRSLVESGLAKVTLDEDWLTVELNSGLLFGSGSARSNSSASAVITELTAILKQTNNFLRVRGYTDSVPIRTEQFPSNWELSVARAASIVRLLEDLGIEPQRMAIEGYGQYSPFADNATAQGRSQNRKVVIALSKYAYEAVVVETPQPVEAETEAEQAAEAAAAQEQQQIRVIRLPHGGIRITTRPPEPGEEEPPIEQEQ
ncbi:MAG: OmpA family protein [Gammaproteobacteria bacterium]|nr:OmpA family protein [Gammaproteobacteria bacterium]MBU2058431.1 OmpA family protein [Gammaproteobacteria bacterium]MBU2176516.1 OmpA family protein [Gammaproteobacteria bacterium]MBU2248542.1 OmpA family protein [Gammaproteobacteria bacterium]MBU2345595.1 OmpA family protein [Gammaproteobacteria bacterium]